MGRRTFVDGWLELNKQGALGGFPWFSMFLAVSRLFFMAAPTDSWLFRRYHKMSLQYHPDKVGGGADATKKFNEIKSARELLG